MNKVHSLRHRAAFAAGVAAALALASMGLTSPTPQTARKWARDALGCFDLLDYEMGLKLAGRSLDRDPDQATLLLRRAAVLWKLARRDVAWLSVQRVLMKAPRNWEALTLSAYFHFVENNVWEAMEVGDRAEKEIDLDLNPAGGSWESWPKSYAPGASDAQDDGLPRRRFPLNAGLSAYLKAVLEERLAGWGPYVENLYRRALALSYDASQCALSICLGRLGAGDWSGVISAAREFQDRGGLRPELILAAAAAEEAAGRRTDSENDLEIAVEMRPFEAGWLKALASAAADRSDQKEAAARIGRAARLRPVDFEARDWSEAAARGVFPFRGEYRHLLREAVDALRPALGPRYRYPLSGNINDVAPVINGRFMRYIQAGQLFDAAQYAGNFLEIDSGPCELAFNAALLYNSMDRVDLAFPLVWLALSNKPLYRDALDLAGQLLIKAGEPVRSVFFYRSALEAGPADAMAWFNLGFAHYSAGNWPAAGECLEKVIALERPDDSQPGERGRTDADRKLIYNLDIHVEPLSYRALILLGLIAVSQRDETGALRRLEEAVGIRPQSPDAYLELGRLYKRLNDPARAKEAFERYTALGGSPELIKK